METSRAVKELLSRHSQLEQSETKAQASLITILSLTQITELKLLLDIGHEGHRFYDMILAMVITCICLELFIGIIIIYIGNLHYYQTSDGLGVCLQLFACLFRRHRHPSSHSFHQSAVHGGGQAGRRSGQTMAKGTALLRDDRHGVDRVQMVVVDSVEQQATTVEMGVMRGGGGFYQQPDSGLECLVQLDQAEIDIRDARIRNADASARIGTAAGYVKVVDEALRRCPGSGELKEELTRAQKDLSDCLQEKSKAEADERLFEAQQHRAFILKELYEDQMERTIFQKLSFWQHMATYLLYFVLLLNIFIATFGISTGNRSSAEVMTSVAPDTGITSSLHRNITERKMN